MRHRKAGRKLSRKADHRKAMFRNMITSLLRNERVQTTDAKARELRRFTEKIITLGKRGDLHARRLAARTIGDKEVLHKLFAELGPRYADRQGGYTRLIKIGFRKGDDAPVTLVELVDSSPLEVAASSADTAEEEAEA